MSVLLNVQGIQSRSHGERGIARYLVELATALDRFHPGIVEAFLVDPAPEAPGVLRSLVERGRTRSVTDVSAGSAQVFHVGSPIELETSLDRVWPEAARGMPLAVTLYDLIPDIFSEHYLADPVSRRRYRARLELVRMADSVLAISGATARDAVERLGLRPDRVKVVGAGVSEGFRRPESPAAAFRALKAFFPRVASNYVLYVGGMDYRKNVEALIAAYGGMAEELRDLHHLVVICRLGDEDLTRLESRVVELGLGGRVHFPGYVSDEQLALFYQAAGLFVFPSLYEGFGLPVAEAIACGAPVIAARNSSLPELLEDDEALFDLDGSESIRASLERTLGDDSLVARLREKRLGDRYTWRAVAERTVAAYEELLLDPLRDVRAGPHG